MRDPYRILQVSRDADDESIRAAFLQAIKKYPPDRHPQQYERLRAAHAQIDTLRNRLSFELLDHDLPDVLDVLEQTAPLQAPLPPDLAVICALLRGEH